MPVSLYGRIFIDDAIMNPTIRIAIIISALSLVGKAAIAVNYSPVPAHAKQGWLRPRSGGSPCFDNRHDCEQPIKDLLVTDKRYEGTIPYVFYFQLN